MRVVEWIIKRCENKVEAVETPIGFMPRPEDINIDGMTDFDEFKLESLLTVDKQAWKKEADDIGEYFKKFGDKLPDKLQKQLRILKSNIKEML